VSGWIERPSPNFEARREGCPIDILVLHYTGMRTAAEALERLCDPAAIVSAHYTIDRDGGIYRHVEECLRARHAGVSYWAGERDVNSRSIGIELVNPGHEFGYLPFPGLQIAALVDLARGVIARHPIPPHRIVGHSDVAPARKMDPGELFPWRELAENGIGIFPPPPAHTTHHGRVEPGHGEMESTFAGKLATFGYGVPPDVDIPLATVVAAFQRHFRPEIVDGVIDAETEARLAALLDMLE
jgi:N-acetylmuramoyl-L-alanine amidase